MLVTEIVCCIYHAPHAVGESSDESSSSSSSDSDSGSESDGGEGDDGRARMGGKGKKGRRRRGSAGDGEGHEGCEYSHDHGKESAKAKRNAYETVPRRKGASTGGGGLKKSETKT